MIQRLLGPTATLLAALAAHLALHAAPRIAPVPQSERSEAQSALATRFSAGVQLDANMAEFRFPQHLR